MAARLVGMIGLGVMGSAMAANLLKAGFKVAGYDPLAACRRRHRSAGGIVAGSALEVARSTRILITSLPSVEALAGVAKEISGQKLKGVIIIETSTLPIPVKQAARKRLAAAGGTLLACPLSGTGAHARPKDLRVYAGGPRAAGHGRGVRGSGKSREETMSEAPQVSKDEQNWAMFCHLSALAGFLIPFGNIVGPVVVWLIKRAEMPLVEYHGKEAINFQI